VGPDSVRFETICPDPELFVQIRFRIQILKRLHQCTILPQESLAAANLCDFCQLGLVLVTDPTTLLQCHFRTRSARDPSTEQIRTRNRYQHFFTELWSTALN
jgi:hypothetical protein